jgi:hypothetical protein
METCLMTEFEKAALQLLSDISARLEKIEEAAQHFQRKSKRADESLRAMVDTIPRFR